MNTGELWPDPYWAGRRVQRMQAKLHRWAAADAGRRFDDLFNLVYHPDFLTVAWERVRGNKGARTAGVDRVRPKLIPEEQVTEFLAGIREQVKSRTFIPLPTRERMIPKSGGKLRPLGIPTAADRVVQASLKLVLEPIFEAEFKPVSYGFRPGRRAQDAIAEIHYLSSGNMKHHWVFEADITACFDELSHTAVLDRVRRRIADKRVLALVRSFLHAGIMSECGKVRRSITGTPQGGILSPLLANIALTVLDEHFCAKWDSHGNTYWRRKHRRNGGALYRIVRYADDFVILVNGTRDHAEALWDEVSDVLAPLGLRLAESKTRVCHMDEGFDFLGFRIQRRRKRGTNRRYVYTYPSKKALASIVGKIRTATKRPRHLTLARLLGEVNPILRGWCNYFRHGVSSKTFGYLDEYAWRRIARWLRHRYPRLNWKQLRRRFYIVTNRWRPSQDGITLFDTGSIEITRYRWRGHKIPSPWDRVTIESAA